MAAGSNGSSGGSAASFISGTVHNTIEKVYSEVRHRAYRASNELRNSSLFVLRGSRGGRVYKVPATHGRRPTSATRSMMSEYGHRLRGGQLYRASAPGQPPAVRTGAFRNSWGTKVHVARGGGGLRAVSSIESHEHVNGYLLGELLENGTSKMAPRPYKQRIIDRALPKIKAIYSAPY